MKIAACASAAWLLLTLMPCAIAQFVSPGVSKMTAAYDPMQQAVWIEETDQPFNYQVQQARQVRQAQAQVYQPPGRVYGVTDPFSVTGPQTVTAPGASFPAYGTPAAPYTTPGPIYGPPTTTIPPMTGYSPGASPPVGAPSGYATSGGYADPYGCQPFCGPPSVAAPLAVGGGLPRSPYSEIEGRFGDPAEVLQTNLMLPFWQQPDVHWFFDFRGQYDDERAGEGNFGVARRQLFSNGLFHTFYGFYDLRHTRYNNNFQQLTIGYELMALEWEYRINGHIPFSGAQANGLNIAELDDNDNIVIRQGLEKALLGIDGEYGWLLTTLGGTNAHEVRAFVGGYYYDESGYDSIAGPRARLEGRMYDLPLLGAGSRFTYGASYQYDSVHDSQWIIGANLRIPFGGGRNRGAGLSPVDRRMLSPLRRDSLVTGSTSGAPEQAVITSTGVVATNVTEINSATANVADTVQNGTGIVVLTSNINTNATIELNPNQFVGGQFAVHGQNSGATALFGQQYTITGTNAANNVLQVADNSTLIGLRVTGGKHGVYGGGDDDLNFVDGDPGVAGFTMTGVTVTSPDQDGVHLDGVTQGVSITGSTFTGAESGLEFRELASGQISGNTANGNTNGFFFAEPMTGGQVTGNTANNNTANGFTLLNGATGGMIAGNSANGNTANGFQSFGGSFSAVMSGNTATDNDFGFTFNSLVNGGSITGNTATANNSLGFYFANTVTAGVISDNTASANQNDGFFFSSINGPTAEIASNTSNGNAGDGFHVMAFDDGDFNDNDANNNTGMGYNFPASPPVPPAAAAGNTGAGNGSVNTFPP